MFRIGEFSKLVRVSARMLRHYDKCGLFKPSEIDKITGYRFYSARQIPMLNQIISLRDMGFSIEEISEFLDNSDNPVFVTMILSKKLAEVKETIAAENRKLRNLSRKLNEFVEEKLNMSFDIVVKEIPPIKVLSLRKTIEVYSLEEELWAEMDAFTESRGIKRLLDNEIFSIYHDPEYKDCDVDVEIAIPVQELQDNKEGFVYKVLEGISCAATVTYTGAYENISYATEAISKWIEENGFQISGNMRGKGIKHYGNESNPQSFITEIQVPIKR